MWKSVLDSITRKLDCAGYGSAFSRLYTSGNEIHENCFYDNEPQACDDGYDNDWTGNFWSDYTPPPPYIIEGDADSKDNNPLLDCPLIKPLAPARVPALTPVGIIALVGLLSVIAAMSIRRKK